MMNLVIVDLERDKITTHTQQYRGETDLFFQ